MSNPAAPVCWKQSCREGNSAPSSVPGCTHLSRQRLRTTAQQHGNHRGQLLHSFQIPALKGLPMAHFRYWILYTEHRVTGEGKRCSPN